MDISEWIDLELNCPPFNKKILVCDAISQIISLGRCCENKDGDICVDFMNISGLPIDVQATHYMELPDLPNLKEYLEREDQ